MVLERERSVEELEDEKRRINEEIRVYPTPIAGCDAQFNSLLEKQAKIVQELDRLKHDGAK
jgi:hypothetical protein